MNDTKSILLKASRVFCLCAVLLLVGCSGNNKSDKPSELKEALKDYNRAVGYDQAWQFRLAELYYGKAYKAVKDNPSQDWDLYGDAAFRYCCMLSNRGDMESAVKVLGDVLVAADGNEEFPPRRAGDAADPDGLLPAEA